MARALMLQGTGSDVGKSLLVAGMARAFTRRGLRVRPFKPQNMSNNAAVTAEGGEIGRAQALQARACGSRRRADMNPVLLKPQSETGAQVIVRRQGAGAAPPAREYRALAPSLLPRVLDSVRAARRDGRSGAGRGRRQPGRGQSARRRHRQYGLCRGRRACRWCWSATSSAAGSSPQLVGTHALLSDSERGAARGLHRQQVPRRSRACSTAASPRSASAPGSLVRRVPFPALAAG